MFIFLFIYSSDSQEKVGGAILRATTNNLHINKDKTTAIIFTPGPAEYSTTLQPKLNNQALPTIKHPKTLEITLDPKLIFSQHINVTINKAKQTLNILKALTSTKWGKQKELIITIFKAITRPILEYANTIWTPVISSINTKKLQTFSEHNFVHCYWLHTRHKHSTPTRRYQGPSNGHPSFMLLNVQYTPFT